MDRYTMKTVIKSSDFIENCIETLKKKKKKL